MLKCFEEPKNLKAGDGLKGGKGNAGNRAAFASAPQGKPSKAILSSFQGTSSTVARLFSLDCYFLKFCQLGEGGLSLTEEERWVELSRTFSVPEFLPLCNPEEDPTIIWQ